MLNLLAMLSKLLFIAAKGLVISFINADAAFKNRSSIFIKSAIELLLENLLVFDILMQQDIFLPLKIVS